jgi:hypothetical protein
MTILFLLGAASRIRNFDRAIELLAERGHTLRLTGRPRVGVFRLPKDLTRQGITGAENPTRRGDEWGRYVETLRGARDYVRYLDPRYAQATRLVRRAYEIAPTEFVLFCERHAWMKRHWRLVSAALALCEDLIPVDATFEAFLRDQQPDLILVTPLVTFESYQTDYVKAAHRLGIPVAFLPFSWDNLTNKGLMRVHPDRTLVWNDVQRREAIELHGARPDTVVMTGAARFDDFFARSAASSREQFFDKFGLDPARPMLLYLGSSQLTGPNEMELVRRWAESLRGSDDPVLRTCGVLVRPHPALKDSWTSVDLSDLGNVGVSLHASRNADQELFDSLYHARAAVGLNTSAMLEAAIVGRPVYTLVIPGFDEGQVGTIHFHYLVEAYGGLATVAHSFDEHHRQLAPALQGLPHASPRSAQFVEGFLRPHGLDRPVSPILAAEIERMGELRKPAPKATPLWHGPLRWALRRWLRRRWAAVRVTEDRTIIGTSMSLRSVKTALQELHDGTAPIFVGPWIDSVATELLCWVPFVRWAAATYGLPSERLIVISRGGARRCYGSLAGRYLDAPALFSKAEREHWMRRTIPQSQQDPKQAVMYPFDQEVIERAARTFDISDYQVLHPLAFFRVLRRLQSDRTVDELGQVLAYERFASATVPDIASQLPGGYVAVSLAFTDALPSTASNRRFLKELVTQVAADDDVVIVDYPDSVDVIDGPTVSRRMRSIASFANEGNYLDLQMNVIAGARAFVGGFGDLAVLAAFCHVPAYTFHSDDIPAELLNLIRSVSTRSGWSMPTTEPVEQFERLRLPARVPA